MIFSIPAGHRSTPGNLLPSFLAEGQAEAAVERVGLALTGLWGSTEMTTSVLGLPGVDLWIPERFDWLSYFQGWDGAGGTVAGAPEGCSLFGFQGACHDEAGPGASWMLPALPGGQVPGHVPRR